MRVASQWFIMLSALVVLFGTAMAQTTITKADVDAAFINSMHIKTSDSTRAQWNLGDGSSGQNWNFSGLNMNSTTVQRETTNYVDPAGHPGVSQFPSAVACLFTHQTSHLNGDTTLTIEIAFYLATQADGAYGLGYAQHLFFSPAKPTNLFIYPNDTTIYSLYRPKQLGFPLPISNTGATVSSTDTMTAPNFFNPNPVTTVTKYTYTLSGEGTLSFPAGLLAKQATRGSKEWANLSNVTSVSAVRMIRDQIQTDYQNGVMTDRNRTKTVMFVGKDLTQVEFEVDTNYTTGSIVPYGWSIDKKAGSALGVKQNSAFTPEKFQINQNYPNPFNPATNIAFDVSIEQYITLKVYNVLGQEVATLVDQHLMPGSYQARFDGSNLSSGVYLYRLSAGAFSLTKSMLLIK